MVTAEQEPDWALSTLLTHHGFCDLGSVFISWYSQDSHCLMLPAEKFWWHLYAGTREDEFQQKTGSFFYPPVMSSPRVGRK